MRILRPIAKAGIALMAVLISAALYGTVMQQQWWGAFILAGSLVMFAAFYDILRVQQLREEKPYAAIAPSRRIRWLLLVIVGLQLAVGGISGVIEAPSAGGVAVFAVGAILLWHAFRVARRET